jgi:ribonuclease D
MGRGSESTTLQPVRKKKEKKRSRFEEIKKEKMNLLFITKDEEVEDIAEMIEKRSPESISLDFETASKNKRWGSLNGSIRLIQIGIEEKGKKPIQIVIDCYKADASPIKKILQNKDIEKQIHYAKFEQEWAWVHLGVKINNIYDTCLAWREIQRNLRDMDETEREKIIPSWSYHDNKLSTILDQYMKVEMPKENQASDWGAEELLDEQIVYATMDVVCLPELTAITKEYAKKTGSEENIKKAIKREQEKTLRWTRSNIDAVGDDADRIIRALERSRSLEELESVWETRKQVTVLPKSEKTLQKRYLEVQKKLTAKEE